MLELYTDYAQDFSRTRQSPWHGWLTVLDTFYKLQEHAKFSNRPLNILDLGCGNGRFANFLEKNQFNCNYLGVDKSDQLLSIARSQSLKFSHSNFKFVQADLNNGIWDSNLTSNYDIVVAFGIMHHIAPFKTRSMLMQKALEHLVPQGIFVVSFWRFGELERYTKKRQPTSKNRGTKYFENDFILQFNGKAERFCHFVSNQELTELEMLLTFAKVDGFTDDGRAGNENLYRIYYKAEA